MTATTPSLREAAQMALEFVEYHSKYWNGTGTHPQEIANALRAALALPEAELSTGDKLAPVGLKPLTDEQIDEIMNPLTRNVEYSWRKFARAIEESHGIKGAA